MSSRRQNDVAEPPGLVRVTDPRVLADLIADMLKAGRPVLFVASGRSMSPTVRDGDRLTVVPRSRESLRPGCIALYRRGADGLTAHRVLSVTESDGERVLRVRGDASRGVIDSVPEECALGIVTQVGRGTREIGVNTPLRRQGGLALARLGTLRTRLGLMLRRRVVSG